MKISIIGPGIMSIPPSGWGAVEILIWDVRNALIKFGHEVQIINTKNYNEFVDQINNFKPDFVHIQYDDFINWCLYLNDANIPNAITSHFGYLEQPNRYSGYDGIFNKFSQIKPNVFCLSKEILYVYKNNSSIGENKLFFTPNGVDHSLFNLSDAPAFPDRSIYLAKIDYRKRQSKFQSIDSLWYAGNLADSSFDISKNYLGEWTKDYLYSNLTDYGNLVLLSDGEAHPLVCMEAMAAGLGLVVSEWASRNLDLSKPWISVIKEDRIGDIDYIREVINDNRQLSIGMRDEIRKYCIKSHSWDKVIYEYYIPSIEKILSKL